MSETQKILQVIITEDPPIGTWAYGRKGATYSVIDKGRYYLLAADINKTIDKRGLPKDFVAIID